MSPARHRSYPLFFFFNDTATTEIYTLSLHDALPICPAPSASRSVTVTGWKRKTCPTWTTRPAARVAASSSYASATRSEEHTSELQSQSNLVCRLLLEKKKKLTSRRDVLLDANVSAVS